MACLIGKLWFEIKQYCTQEMEIEHTCTQHFKSCSFMFFPYKFSWRVHLACCISTVWQLQHSPHCHCGIHMGKIEDLLFGIIFLNFCAVESLTFEAEEQGHTGHHPLLCEWCWSCIHLAKHCSHEQATILSPCPKVAAMFKAYSTTVWF